MKKFQYLLEPRSIAVVGVSDDMARPGSQAVNALLANGYAGQVFPVNPKYENFGALKCYSSVVDIPHDVDLVVIGVPAKGVLAVLEQCAEKRVPYVVILSGGFRESGAEGIEREQKMLEITRKAGIRVVGPNCLGFANIHSSVYAAFGSITRAPKLKKGAVSLVTQSGGFGYSIALACADAGVGFRHVIATGNESDIDTIQLIDALIDDDETRCIVAYIEGTSNGRALLEVGRRALAVGKPVLLWKGGVTEQGAKAAESHTASLTGTYDFYRAMFKQTGIIEIQELHEAVDFVKALASGKYPAGRGVAVMGVSGGSAIVFADAGERAALQMCDLVEETQQRLAQVVPSIGAIHNPIDLTAGYFSAANKERMEVALRAVLDDPGAHAVCVNLATTGKSGSLAAAEVMAQIAKTAAKPLVVFSSSPSSEIGEALQLFADAAVPVLPSPSRAARAIAMLATYAEARAELIAAAGQTLASKEPDAQLHALARKGTLSETDSKAILARAGVTVTKDILVSDADASVFDQLNAPLVVKIVSADIPHKTEIGGVRVGIASRVALASAMAEVLDNARARAPAAVIQGVLVSEMIRGGFELIAGVVNDPVFGPMVIVGAGGIYTEILRDSTCRIAPFDERTARQMVDELKCRPMLDGARGGEPLDVAAVAQTLAALSVFAWDNRDVVREIDINPLFVLPQGAIAADGLIVPHERADA